MHQNLIKILGSWSVSNVTNMGNMFQNAAFFNQDIGNWNVSSVIDLSGMFWNAIYFNQNLSYWCVENITTEQEDFSTNSPLSEDNKPVWGTCPDATSNENHELPLAFLLEQNYPNPFNPVTVIGYQIPKSSDVRLEVIDMLGRRVSLLINERVEAGRHEATLDASGLSSGMYIYRLQTGNEVLTRKMMLIK